MSDRTKTAEKKPKHVRKKRVAVRAAEAGVKTAQDVFAKILKKADPKPKPAQKR